MTITYTKYNKIPKLYEDLSNTSFQTLYLNNKYIDLRKVNKIFTCDISDILIDVHSNIEIIKTYKESKANFLINPFVPCQINQFNNEKEIYKYKPPNRDNSSIPISEIQIQKEIQNQVRVPSSLYTMNKSALSINNENLHSNNKNWNNMSDRKIRHGKQNQINSSTKQNSGVDIKHNSYARHLGKLKSQNLKTETENNHILPIQGNKNRKFGMFNCISIC